MSPPFADDPLDERACSSSPQSVGWIEHDDVAALVGIEPWRQLVDQHVLLRLQRPLHRLLLDLVRLGDEVLDDDKDDEGQDERLDDLEETPERGSLAHKSGSIGAAALGRPEGFGTSRGSMHIPVRA